MDIIWYLAILGAVKSSLGDFFSDLEELDIDAQLREIDEMMDKIDNDTDDGDLKFDDIGNLFSDDCLYKCGNGAKPVPRKGHVPKTNGCGSFGLTLDTSALPEMTKCCDKHDYCYDTCNADRGKCDDDFKQCLDNMCDKLRPSITRNQYEGCKETATLIYGGTTALGCSPFLSAQEKACDCPSGGRDRSSTSSDKLKTETTNNKKKRPDKSDTKEAENIKDQRLKTKHEKRDKNAEARFSETDKMSKKKRRNPSDEL